MTTWAEVDEFRLKLHLERSEKHRAKLIARSNDQVNTGRRHVVRHVARQHLAYTCKTKRGEKREMAPGELWNKTFGAATLKSMILRALCGDLRANEPELLHRTTVRVKFIGCERCRVLLDAEVEAGRLVITDKLSLEPRGTVGLHATVSVRP